MCLTCVFSVLWSLLVLAQTRTSLNEVEVVKLLEGGNWIFDLNKEEKYDHKCRLMKSRYNIEADPREPKSHQTTFFITNDVGQLERLDEINPSHLNATVVLYGNSFLRQIQESIFCTFDMRERFDTLVLREFINNAWRNHNQSDGRVTCSDLQVGLLQEGEGCHGWSTGALHEQFYRSEAPPNTKGCNDDVSLITFDGGLRIAFIFRPSVFQDIECILQLLGISLHEITHIFHNDLDHKTPAFDTRVGTLDALRKHASPLVKVFDCQDVPQKLMQLQKRDLNIVYDASNRFYLNDVHPALPGIPDVEALIILRLISNTVDENENRQQELFEQPSPLHEK